MTDDDIIVPGPDNPSPQRPMIAYYAHLDLPNNPPARSTWGLSWPERIGGHPVFLDPRIYHVKVGPLKHMKFGLPDFYSAIDWATAYKDFLQDAASTWKSLSVFSWKRIGGKTVAEGNQITLVQGSKGIYAINGAIVKDNTVRKGAATYTIRADGGSAGILFKDNQVDVAISNSGGASNTEVGTVIIAA